MSRPVIAVIDDQRFICETIDSMLRSSYEVHAFVSGESALKYIAENPVDFVLLDYDMPEMSGYEVLMTLKADPGTSKTPVVFLSAEKNERMKMQMIERGAADYICKPIDSSLLHSCIKQFLPE